MPEGYESHLVVLETLLKKFKIKNVLEYGMGFGSTLLFLKHCNRLVSVEQQDFKWFSTIIDRYEKEYVNCECNFFPMFETDFSKTFRFIQSFNATFDLIFVDGCVAGRVPAVHDSFNKTNLVVIHDTEHRAIVVYNWNNLRIPKGWFRKDCKTFPQTTILTKDKKFLEI